MPFVKGSESVLYFTITFYVQLFGKKIYFLQHLWRQFYDSLEQPDPKHGKYVIHHLQRAGTHTFLLRENIKSVQNLSTKLIRTVVRMSIECICVCVCCILVLCYRVSTKICILLGMWRHFVGNDVILTGSHNFRGLLFEGLRIGFKVRLRTGFRLHSGG